MKTIAISIDEGTLAEVDRIVREGDEGARNRSELVRRALKAYVCDLTRRERNAREDRILRENRALLARQAAALVRDQARP